MASYKEIHISNLKDIIDVGSAVLYDFCKKTWELIVLGCLEDLFDSSYRAKYDDVSARLDSGFGFDFSYICEGILHQIMNGMPLLNQKRVVAELLKYCLVIWWAPNVTIILLLKILEGHTIAFVNILTHLYKYEIGPAEISCRFNTLTQLACYASWLQGTCEKFFYSRIQLLLQAMTESFNMQGKLEFNNGAGLGEDFVHITCSIKFHSIKGEHETWWVWTTFGIVDHDVQFYLESLNSPSWVGYLHY